MARTWTSGRTRSRFYLMPARSRILFGNGSHSAEFRATVPPPRAGGRPRDRRRRGRARREGRPTLVLPSSTSTSWGRSLAPRAPRRPWPCVVPRSRRSMARTWTSGRTRRTSGRLPSGSACRRASRCRRGSASWSWDQSLPRTPVPSRLIATSIAVSLVFLLIVLVRIPHPRSHPRARGDLRLLVRHLQGNRGSRVRGNDLVEEAATRPASSANADHCIPSTAP